MLNIRRWWHRQGFGVQSPWAYDMIRNVLFEHLRYYALDELRKRRREYTLHGECLRRHDDEQLFRLANALHPDYTMEAGIGSGLSLEYLRTACGRAVIKTVEDGNSDSLSHLLTPGRHVDLLHIAFTADGEEIYDAVRNGHIGDTSAVVVDFANGRHRKLWARITADEKATAVFDMQCRGVAFFDSNRIKQIYYV